MLQRESVLNAALQLDKSDRVFLAYALLESTGELDYEFTEADKKEILSRQQEMKANPQIGIPWEQAKAIFNLKNQSS